MREQLFTILKSLSVITGKEFKLASGKTSNFYIDARLTTLYPESSWLIGNIFFDMLQDYDVEAVGGYSIGADPIVTAIALVSHLRYRPLPAFIIRKEAKEHGTGKIIEGNFKNGLKVALFDDVITSGGSIIKGIETVRQAGGVVKAVMAVVDRLEGGREAIEKKGVPFISIFTRNDFIKS